MHLVDTHAATPSSEGRGETLTTVCVFVRVCVGERRGIRLHFSLPRRGESSICFKHPGLINKSLVSIHSSQGWRATISINHVAQRGAPYSVKSE